MGKRTKPVEALEEIKEPVKVEPPVEESPPQVTLGVSTINDHEQRLWVIERKLGLR